MPVGVTPGTSGSTNRSLTGWLIGFGSSLLADQVFFLSLTWTALQLGSAQQVGLVLAAGSIPRLLMLLVGGVVADRASPKRIIIGTDSGRAVVMAVAALVLMLGSLHTGGLILVALAVGALDGFFLPAVGALPARIAPPHLLGRVAALRTVTQRAAMLIGGPLAGWLIYAWGPAAAFWGSAALFAVSVTALALVTVAPLGAGPRAVAERARRRAAGPRRASAASAPENPSTGRPVPARGIGSWWARSVSGLREVRRHPVLPWLLLLIAGMNFGFAGPVTAGIPLLAADQQWGAPGAGFLLGGFGLGAAVSGLGLVFVRRIPRAGWVALGGVSAMGVALALVSVSPTLPAALVAAVVLGLASGVLGTVVHAMLLTSTPKAELGRVMGLVSLSIEGVVPLSFAATGLAAGAFGAQTTFLIGGAIILAATALTFTRRPLRSFELPRSEEPQPVRIVRSAPVTPSSTPVPPPASAAPVSVPAGVAAAPSRAKVDSAPA